MVLVRKVDINELQPTDIDLDPKISKYYATTFPLLREDVNMPEIWVINDQMYISDGHHQIADRYQRRNKIHAICHTPKNCNISSNAYAFVIAEILKKAQIARRKGIRHIQDLQVKL